MKRSVHVVHHWCHLHLTLEMGSSSNVIFNSSFLLIFSVRSSRQGLRQLILCHSQEDPHWHPSSGFSMPQTSLSQVFVKYMRGWEIFSFPSPPFSLFFLSSYHMKIGEKKRKRKEATWSESKKQQTYHFHNSTTNQTEKKAYLKKVFQHNYITQ